MRTGTITGIDRLPSSHYGNPRYVVTIDGESYVTSSDHAFCYEVGNPGLRVGDTVTYTLSRAGRLTNLKGHSPA